MEVRNDWTLAEVEALFALPFMDLVFQAQQVHRRYHAPNTVQISTLLSIKTGACPEDCAYCPQSIRYDTGLEAEELLELEAVVARAHAAKQAGATRFCMGAAYRSPKPRDLLKVSAMIREVKALGLETCATLGMVSGAQARELKAAGLDYYNHNLDTSAAYYEKIVTTRTYQDRLDTLQAVRSAGMSVCCGGIVGMGEAPEDRAGLLHTLATLPTHPESVPINHLVRVAGTPLAQTSALDPFDFVRTVAVARILLPRSHVRLSAGRSEMSDELQALCFLAGANSIFYGEKLLTTGNPDTAQDQRLFRRLQIHAEPPRPAQSDARPDSRLHSAFHPESDPRAEHLRPAHFPAESDLQPDLWTRAPLQPESDPQLDSRRQPESGLRSALRSAECAPPALDLRTPVESLAQPQDAAAQGGSRSATT